MKRLTPTNLLYLLVCILVDKSDQMRFIATYGSDTVATNVSVTTKWSRSKIECSATCKQRNTCRGYNFYRSPLTMLTAGHYQCDLIDSGQATDQQTPLHGATYYEEDCYGGYEKVAGYCYKLIATNMNWDDAANECINNNGCLAQFMNEAEMLNAIAFVSPSNANAWVGAHRDALSNFRWVGRNTAIDGALWISGEPSSPLEECAEMAHDLAPFYYLNDNGCDQLRSFLCQTHDC